MREFIPGERVFVSDEASNGTVIKDNGFGKNWDGGVDVKLDSDGVTVHCAHESLYPEDNGVIWTD